MKNNGTDDYRTRINIILNAIIDTLAEGHAIPESYAVLAAEQAGYSMEDGKTALALARAAGICSAENNLLTAGPKLADLLAAKRAHDAKYNAAQARG